MISMPALSRFARVGVYLVWANATLFRVGDYYMRLPTGALQSQCEERCEDGGNEYP